jgi:hypothetical protein
MDESTQLNNNIQYCKGINSKKKPCKKIVKNNEEYCYHHGPSEIKIKEYNTNFIIDDSDIDQINKLLKIFLKIRSKDEYKEKNKSNGESSKKEEDDEEESTCIICLEELKGMYLTELKCKHVYHSSCILTWFENEFTCPLCKRQSILINKIK